MKKLRQAVGLEGYEVMKMTDTDVQALCMWMIYSEED